MATDPPARAHPLGYETRDANPCGLFIFFACIGIFLVLTSVAVAWFFGHLTKTDIAPPATSQSFENARPLPPPPLLQPAPTVDIQQYVQSQQTLLDSYGWVDRPQGVVRIPIDRAMELLSQKGFPVRPQQGTQAGTSGTQSRSETGAARSPASTANRPAREPETRRP